MRSLDDNDHQMTAKRSNLSLLFNFVIFCSVYFQLSVRKHAYSNILKILPPNNENFQMKNSDIFHISAQNIICGFSRGGSNEYPQSMF